ncbi:MAG TPA: 4Fe-4S binding protein [Candidatus Brocadiia bacterium]|nr:4Fe-4S binding protein [Candidatus Brocadiia bacterium]
MAKIRILQRYCKGCELCVTYCPNGVLAMPAKAGHAAVRIPVVVDESRCVLCLRCAAMCPDAAIEIEKPPKPAAAKS